VKEPIISKRPKTDSAPLSFAQLQMWLMDQMTPGNPAYGLPIAYRVKGPLDVLALENSFNEIIRRHEVLRTTFTVNDGEPLQVIHQACKIRIGVTELELMPPDEREHRLHILASHEAGVPFDLSRLPLIRVLLFKVSHDDHVLFINLHHIVADGLSLRLMLDELDRHYQVFTGSRHDDRLDLRIQYADFALWQRQTVAAKNYVDEIAFWRRQLHGTLPVLELPADLPRPVVQSFKGSNIFFEIPKALAQDLAALGAREGCTLFTTLLAAFQVLLQRYSGADDLVIGTPLAVRTPTEEPLIGNFLNMIPLRCDLSGDPTFLRVLRRTRRMTLHVFAKAGLPFEMIVENVTFQRDPSRNPIFQVMFEVLPAVTSRIGELQVSSFYFDLRFAQFDLSLHAWEEAYGYACRFEYCTDVFRADTIERMSAHFVQLLSSVVANPNQRIATIPILTESEKTQLLVDWNRTSRAYRSDRCLHQLFETTAASHPSRIAIECGGRALTYGELNARANRLANHLIKSGVKTEELVGVYLERSPDLVIGLLGILKAGAAYVPLDPSFPPERMAYMMNDAGISIVVTQSNLLETLPPGERTPICLDRDGGAIRLESASDPSLPLAPSKLAYTIYTSGSSGKPKGVMIEHRSLVNCLTAMQREPGFGEHDVLVAVTTISFDIAALEIFLPLISGGKLVIAGKNEALDGSLLAQLMERSRATMLQATPSTWRLLIDANWKGTPELKMLCGGEALPRELANRLLERDGELWNMYGPTETTIWSAVHRVESTAGPVPIGPPISNTQFYIVDKELEPVPIGVPGELLIGGDGVSRGYLNRPDLTAERFLSNRFSCSETRLYKTGDLARFRSDGRIEFLGRRDFQVKVRGYRIELEEVEHVLAQHESVKDVAVVTWEDQDGDKRLVAYYIPREGKKAATADLRRHLQEKLPDYMCPSFFVELQTFPFTPNGKIDRKAFPQPDLSTLKVSSRHVAPQRQQETRLVAIWQELLKRQPIGLDDNFFELGGHSLLAARMFVQMEKKLGVKLPLAMLFQSPTIRKLADKIEEMAGSSNWNSLVPIQTQGSKPPLFLVHGAEGNVLLYRSLAESLGKDQPVYGLQSQGLDGGELFEPKLESIAAKYLEEIQSAQATGPYYLGGYCLGGTIAFEIAQQLTRAGESVALLAMFETYNVQSAPPVSVTLGVIHKAENLYFQVKNLALSGGSVEFFAEKLKVEVSRFKVHCNILWARIVDRFHPSRGVSYQHLRIQAANHQAQAAYQPVPYDGRITLFKPKVHYREFNDRHFGWENLAMQGVQIVEMPNYPRGSLNEPFVNVLARRLKAEIEKTLHAPVGRQKTMIVPGEDEERRLVG
jgi:amino acid adenylation domain-containing protein